MTRTGGLGGEADAVAARSGTEADPPSAAEGEAPHIVPRDVPIDEYSDLPEGLKETAEEEPEVRKDDPDEEPAEKAGPAS